MRGVIGSAILVLVMAWAPVVAGDVTEAPRLHDRISALEHQLAVANDALAAAIAEASAKAQVASVIKDAAADAATTVGTAGRQSTTADDAVVEAQRRLAEATAAANDARAVAEEAKRQLRAATMDQQATMAAAQAAEAAAQKAADEVTMRTATRDALALRLEAMRSAADGPQAILYEEPAAGTDGTVTAVNAEVHWRYFGDGPGGPEVYATVNVPGRYLIINLSFRKNADDTLPASHLWEVAVVTPTGSQELAIDSIPRIVLKSAEDAPGQPLVGAAAKVSNGLFRIALSAAGSDMKSNLSLIRDRSWIDLPFVYGNGRRAILTFEKGRDGEEAFHRAFAAWDADRAAPIIAQHLTIPGGLTSKQVIDCLMADRQTDNVNIPALTLEQKIGCSEAADALAGPRPVVPPEGVLSPGIYAFHPGETRKGLVDLMMRDHKNVVGEVWKRRTPDLPIDAQDKLVVLASIVEKETAIDHERPRIAAVFLNRLRLNMRLQSDPTFIYGIYGGAGMPDGYVATAKDRDTPTPYNTYTIDGLPPGPIANPSRASLEAVANPARTRDLFFVADGAGGHAFAETYEEHLRNVDRWRAQRSANCTSAEEAFGGDGARFNACHGVKDGQRFALVSVTGQFALGDERYFNRALLTVDAPRVIVALESPGGSVDAGLRIGRTVWNNEYETLARGECLSMCAVVWLAGRPRHTAPDAKIGFHAPWRGPEDRVEISSVGSALVGGYLQDIGITRAAIEYMTEPGPEEMQILTREDAARYGITFRDWSE